MKVHDALREAASHLGSSLTSGALPDGSHETAAQRITDAQAAVARICELTQIDITPSPDGAESILRHL